MDTKLSDFRVTPADKSGALAFYARVAKNYESHVNSNPLLRFFRRRERSAIEKLLKLDERVRSLIDVGCGAGIWSRYAKERGLYVKAVDANVEMVENIRPFVDESEVVDLDEWKPTAKFDRVVCTGVLEFVLHPEKAMQTLCSLVAPQGRLVILANVSGPVGIYYRIEKALIGVRVNLFSKQWLIEQASRCGLKLIERIRPLPSNAVYAFINS